MAARVAHEGGHLRLIKAPENVTEYVKSGPKMSKLQVKLRSNQNNYRKYVLTVCHIVFASDVIC
jgi:hypothetical protein